MIKSLRILLSFILFCYSVDSFGATNNQFGRYNEPKQGAVITNSSTGKTQTPASATQFNFFINTVSEDGSVKSGTATSTANSVGVINLHGIAQVGNAVSSGGGNVSATILGDTINQGSIQQVSKIISTQSNILETLAKNGLLTGTLKDFGLPNDSAGIQSLKQVITQQYTNFTARTGSFSDYINSVNYLNSKLENESQIAMSYRSWNWGNTNQYDNDPYYDVQRLVAINLNMKNDIGQTYNDQLVGSTAANAIDITGGLANFDTKLGKTNSEYQVLNNTGQTYKIAMLIGKNEFEMKPVNDQYQVKDNSVDGGYRNADVRDIAKFFQFNDTNENGIIDASEQTVSNIKKDEWGNAITSDNFQSSFDNGDIKLVPNTGDGKGSQLSFGSEMMTVAVKANSIDDLFKSNSAGSLFSQLPTYFTMADDGKNNYTNSTDFRSPESLINSINGITLSGTSYAGKNLFAGNILNSSRNEESYMYESYHNNNAQYGFYFKDNVNTGAMTLYLSLINDNVGNLFNTQATSQGKISVGYYIPSIELKEYTQSCGQNCQNNSAELYLNVDNGKYYNEYGNIEGSYNINIPKNVIAGSKIGTFTISSKTVDLNGDGILGNDQIVADINFESLDKTVGFVQGNVANMKAQDLQGNASVHQIVASTVNYETLWTDQEINNNRELKRYDENSVMFLLSDNNQDGKIESLGTASFKLYQTLDANVLNDNGTPQSINVDLNGDGIKESYSIDSNGGIDVNNDGKIDYGLMDIQHNNTMHVVRDMNGDGIIDALDAMIIKADFNGAQ